METNREHRVDTSYLTILASILFSVCFAWLFIELVDKDTQSISSDETQTPSSPTIVSENLDTKFATISCRSDSQNTVIEVLNTQATEIEELTVLISTSEEPNQQIQNIELINIAPGQIVSKNLVVRNNNATCNILRAEFDRQVYFKN